VKPGLLYQFINGFREKLLSWCETWRDKERNGGRKRKLGAENCMKKNAKSFTNTKFLILTLASQEA
jgi:hypothetical protein